MSQCKAYTQKKINPDLWLNVIPKNCGNCQLWDTDIERCSDETVALNMNELSESLKLCDW